VYNTQGAADVILVDLASAYGKPIKLSFSLENSQSKLYIYFLVAGDFGVSSVAKIAKY
jgi:hypothetical protein